MEIHCWYAMPIQLDLIALLPKKSLHFFHLSSPDLLFGFDADHCMNDDEIVEHATRKIRMLKQMMLATGMHADLLKACMEN